MERKAQQTAGDDKDLDVLVHPVTRTESLDYSKPEANLPGKISDDDVEAFIARHGGVQTYTEESNRKLIRRIDLHIMPLMCVSYCLQYVDKSAVAYAAVFGIREDLKLVGPEFGLLNSLFYLAYLCAEYPMAVLAQKFHIGRFLGTIIFIWGLVLMSTALCHNFSQIAAVRFILGWFEAALTPSFIMITGMWYTRQEQPLRIGIWYAMNGFGNMFGALTSYGMGKIEFSAFKSWRWIFILEGAATVLWAFVIFFYFPASPMRAKWLSPQESVQAIERIRTNRTGILNRTWKWDQVREALNPLVDPIPWLLFWTCVFNEVINGAIAPFKTLITQSLGWNSFQSALFGIAQGFALTSYIASAGYIASHKKNWRCWTMMIYVIPTAIGLILLATVPERIIGLRTFALLLLPSFIGSLAICMGLPSQNTAGYTKRSVAVGMAFIGYCIGNIIGPFSMVDGQKPQYLSGYITCLGCIGLQLFCFSVLRWYWAKQNRVRDLDLHNDPVIDGEEFSDKTDLQDKSFRYNL